MIFDPETFLYVSSIPKPQIHEFFIFIFTKWRIFSNSLLFSGKTAFLSISADFVTRFEKFFFHLKALPKRMLINVNNFFVAQVVPEINAKNTSLKNIQMWFFVTYCIKIIKQEFLNNIPKNCDLSADLTAPKHRQPPLAFFTVTPLQSVIRIEALE